MQKGKFYFIKAGRNNKTILHATHSLERVPEFSDRVLLLDHGKMAMIGKPDEVINHYKEKKHFKT